VLRRHHARAAHADATLCAKRKQFGDMHACEPSRFLAELPSEDVVWEGRDAPIPNRPKRARARRWRA